MLQVEYGADVIYILSLVGDGDAVVIVNDSHPESGPEELRLRAALSDSRAPTRQATRGRA